MSDDRAGRLYYRIVRSAAPTLDDFRSARNLGKPLIVARYEREWAESVSVYDDLAYAMARAVKHGFKLGEYVATLEIPDDRSVEVKQTTSDRHHFSMYASPDQLLRMVRGTTVRVTAG